MRIRVVRLHGLRVSIGFWSYDFSGLLKRYKSFGAKVGFAVTEFSDEKLAKYLNSFGVGSDVE